MADPATITLAVKAAIAAILTPFILVIVMILSLLSGTSQHSNAAIDLCFNGGVAGSSVPAEYTVYIEDIFFVSSRHTECCVKIERLMNRGLLRICLEVDTDNP